MNPLASVLPSLLDFLFSRDVDHDDEQDGSQHDDAIGCANELACRDERLIADATPTALAPIDLQAKAAKATYSSGSIKGKAKRTLYAPVDLSKRRVVIGLHQMGVELPSSWPSWWKVTGHLVIRTDGTPLILHPVRTRLVATNRVDRAPWHCIAIEFAVNAEGVDGSGRWYAPERNGRGRISESQIAGGRWACGWIYDEVRKAGGQVMGILPHITTGRDSRGRPNRQICPGSRIWSNVGEWAAVEYGLAIPGPTWKAGGLPLPPAWRGVYYDRADDRLLPAA